MSQIAEVRTKRATAAISQLDQLKRWTKVVADTGDFGTLREFAPEDATTNPSLIFKAAQMQGYGELVSKAIADNHQGTEAERLSRITDELLVLFGAEILKVVPGRVSTETDADLSFDTPGLVAKARRFIELYKSKGVPRERVLVKLASTWEGIRAAETLQKEGIQCNMTLLFSLPQAMASADAGARLISPFVGRILDWFKKQTGRNYAAQEDPGVLSVREIYEYYKKYEYPTEVMGASFRTKEEVLELAGCDLLTISPHLLSELKASTERVDRKLDPATVRRSSARLMPLDEKQFRWLLNENAMATEKLAEGIRLFNADAVKLREWLRNKLNE